MTFVNPDIQAQVNELQKRVNQLEAANTEYQKQLVEKDQKLAVLQDDLASRANNHTADNFVSIVQMGRLKDFADSMLSIAWEGNDADGGMIQESAVSAGILKEVNSNESCGDNCGCVEHGFPAICYRKTYESAAEVKPAKVELPTVILPEGTDKFKGEG